MDQPPLYPAQAGDPVVRRSIPFVIPMGLGVHCCVARPKEGWSNPQGASTFLYYELDCLQDFADGIETKITRQGKNRCSQSKSPAEHHARQRSRVPPSLSLLSLSLYLSLSLSLCLCLYL